MKTETLIGFLFCAFFCCSGCGVPIGPGYCTMDGCWESSDYQSSYHSIEEEQQAYKCSDDPTQYGCCSDDPSDHRRPYCSLVYGPQRPKLIEDKNEN